MAKQIHHPFAFCPVHGVFSAPWVAALAPGTSIRFEDCVTNCPIPNCDKKYEIISGLYETKADRLNVLLHPSISVEALTAIRELALKLQSGKITPAQASRATKKIHPAAARLFDIRHWPAEARATLLAGVVYAAGTIIAAKINSPPTQIVNVQPVIERVVTKDDLLTTSSVSRPKIPLPRPRPTPPDRHERKKHHR
jgi:hypothetical protein